MRVFKGLTKLSLILFFVFLIGCTDENMEEIDTDKSAYYDAIYNLHFNNYESIYDQYFSDELKEELSLEELEKQWLEITDDSGEYLRVRFLRTTVDEELDLKLIEARIEYEHVIFDIRMEQDENQEVVDFALANAVVNAQRPDLVVEESVIIGEETDYKLGATITLPRYMQVNLPAVVLVHGSGPSDRDGTALSYKPFRDIAWELAEQGIAVIRYDKRTLTHSEEMLEDLNNITVYEETVEDAIRAAEVLRNDDRIDENNVFVLGHSLGGMLAPRIDKQGGNFAGIISLAGSPRPLWEIIYDQNQHFKDIYLTDETEKEFHMEMIEEEYEKALELENMTLEEAKDISIFGINGYYLKEMANYDVESLVLQLDKPILIMQGEDDFQVFYEKDFAAWRDLLSNKENATLVSYKNLNHFFIRYEGKDKGTIEEYHHPGKVSKQVTNDIGTWIIQNQN